MSIDFHALTIADIRQEIGGNATSITLAVPPDLSQIYSWQAGQHLPLRLRIDGEEHRRCYTISNPPGAPLRITVKRVKGGVVSNHIAESLKIGETLDAMPPLGQFALQPDPMARRTHYFFGGGSGITPLFAMIKDVLAHEPHSVSHLIFGNKTADGILFRAELAALADAHEDRFTLRHILSAPSLWSWFSPWRKGRIGADAISAAFAESSPVAQDVKYWICGPGAMNKDVRDALMALDVPADRIHLESFGGAEMDIGSPVNGMAATASVILNGRCHDVTMAADQTVLEAALASGLKPPHSCRSGVCGACKARLKTGKVMMRTQMALCERDILQGDILTCQSVAQTPTIEVEFPS
ncbi:ketosteroid-9-alpha-hydroxylase [Phaeobacter sp. LSS9]|uniref:ferredoxin--NADP reductase n=1 Tax=unclassified Phaeobacter TaxID=2621772 RepID=UPI000E4DE41E|nr:ferredoxin--NADP reductase [Phaeobacter sp. LSS9]AXT34865.1 ketosteroid-9-alpha-hydroxylase [Phaeobacter sp. LSS9]